MSVTVPIPYLDLASAFPVLERGEAVRVAAYMDPQEDGRHAAACLWTDLVEELGDLLPRVVGIYGDGSVMVLPVPDMAIFSGFEPERFVFQEWMLFWPLVAACIMDNELVMVPTELAQEIATYLLGFGLMVTVHDCNLTHKLLLFESFNRNHWERIVGRHAMLQLDEYGAKLETQEPVTLIMGLSEAEYRLAQLRLLGYPTEVIDNGPGWLKCRMTRKYRLIV